MRTPWKITKNNSQGIIFVIISCQRVLGGHLLANMGAGGGCRTCFHSIVRFAVRDSMPLRSSPFVSRWDARTWQPARTAHAWGISEKEFVSHQSRTKNQPKEEVPQKTQCDRGIATPVS